MVPPHPQRQQKFRNIFLMNLHAFYEKSQKIFTRGLKKGSAAKKHENYSGSFPEGVQKEEIQQWRQARSRPREKETHNIKLRENVKNKEKGKEM